MRRACVELRNARDTRTWSSLQSRSCCSVRCLVADLSESQRNTFWGARAAAPWFEMLAVAQFTRRGGRPLQQRLAETNLNPSWSEKHASENAVIFQFFGIGE
jgi:hypothetical protein